MEPTPNRKRQHAQAWLECKREEEIVWREAVPANVWHDEGEKYMLSAVFALNYSGYGAALGTLYMGLDCRTAIGETDTLATLLAEPTSASGYQRQSLVNSGSGVAGQDFVISETGAYFLATSATKTFSASTSSWGTIRAVFLTTDPTATTPAAGDRLLCSLATSTPRTVNSGETVNAWMSVGISEP